MRYIVYITAIIILGFAACSSKKRTPASSDNIAVQCDTLSYDTLDVYSKPVTKTIYIYSEDSLFMMSTIVNISKDTSDEVFYPHIVTYMKYKGQFKEVHELDGGDIIFIYTDSTKSRYLYDKRGKHFLREKEKDLYWSFYFKNL